MFWQIDNKDGDDDGALLSFFYFFDFTSKLPNVYIVSWL